MNDGMLKMQITDAEKGYLNIRLEWPSKSGEPPNLGEITIGLQDAKILTTGLASALLDRGIVPDIR